MSPDMRAVLWPFQEIERIFARAASVDTHPKGGDANAAPFMSGAVGEAETPNLPSGDAQ